MASCRLRSETVVVGLGVVGASAGAGPFPASAVGLDGPAAVGFEVVPAADAGGEAVAGGDAAVVEGLVVFDVGGGRAGGPGGGVGGVPVAGGDELGEACGGPVDVGVVVEVVGGAWAGEHVPDRLGGGGDGGEEGGVGGAIADGVPQVGGDGDAEHDRCVQLSAARSG